MGRTAAALFCITTLACAPGGVSMGPSADDDLGPRGPDAGLPASGRVVEGLQALYLFDEGVGTVVYDHAGTQAGLDLEITAAGAVWVADGLSITSPNLLTTAGSVTGLAQECLGSNAITVEAWSETADPEQAGPARIIDLSGGPNVVNVSLGQQQDLADVRLRTTGTELDGTPSVNSIQASFTGQATHVLYTWSGLVDQASLFVNGQLASSELKAGALTNWDSGYALSVANEPGGNRPWRGELYLVAIYCRALSAAEVYRNFEEGYMK